MRSILPLLALILLTTRPAALPAQETSYDAPPAYSQSGGESSMPLKPQTPADHDQGGKPSDKIRTMVTVGGSLAVVLGIFFAVVWLVRRAAPGGSTTLPIEVFEVLGRAPLANHQHVQLVRCGVKLLLVAVSSTTTAANAATLAEITDPAEVERLVVLCRQGRGGNTSPSFRQASHQTGGRRE